MAFEPVKIPQNIYVEDHIFGPITLRHLIIMAIGTAISYLIWAIVTSGGVAPSMVVTVLCWSPTGIAAAFAFLRVNDMSLFRIILLTIEQASKPAMRYWSPHTGISINFVTQAAKDDPNAAKEKAYLASSKLAELATKLEEEKRAMEKQSSEETHDELGSVRPLPVNRSRISAGGVQSAPSVDGISAQPR